MFGQWYMQTAPSFSIPNFSLAPYTPWGNGRTYVNASGNYQALYCTVAYTDPIPSPGSSLSFLSNQCLRPAGGLGYETPPQFPFRSQPIDMTPARARAEPCSDPNNLTNQLVTILHESLGIEPKGRGCVYKKSYPDYYGQLPYHRGYRVPEFSKFSGEDGKTTL
jgi:hypothetical protein